jgi:SAGA-associated factor 73
MHLGALVDANAPLTDDFEAPGTVDSDEEREAVMSAISRSFRANPFTGARIGGASLVPQPLISTRSKYYRVRVKETLTHALSGVNGKSMFATPATTNMNMNTGAVGGMMMSGGLMSAGPDGPITMSAMSMQGDGFDSRRTSIARSSGLPGSRKPSLSSIQV